MGLGGRSHNDEFVWVESWTSRTLFLTMRSVDGLGRVVDVEDGARGPTIKGRMGSFRSSRGRGLELGRVVDEDWWEDIKHKL